MKYVIGANDNTYVNPSKRKKGAFVLIIINLFFIQSLTLNNHNGIIGVIVGKHPMGEAKS